MCWGGEERSVGEGKGRCGGVKKRGGGVGKCEEVCWSVGEGEGKGMGGYRKGKGRLGV